MYLCVYLLTEEAERKLVSLGSTWEWAEDGSGNLKTVTAILPAIRIDSGDRRTGEKTFFNSMVAAYSGWNDSRNIGEKAVMFGNGEFCDPVAMADAIRIMDEICVAIPWQQNDFFLIDNRTVMHSRKPFEGPRRILASLVRDPSR
jgi:hypothetical protein